MSTISTSTTTNTGYVVTSDTTGALVIQTGATPTTAVTVSSAQLMTLPNDATISGLTVGKGGGAVATNTAVGASALHATNTGGKCTAFGYQALTLTTGKENTAFGSDAGASMTSGEGLAAFGWSAAKLNTADNVTALGHNTLGANTTGANNTAVGNAALNVNTTGASNTAVGRQALVSNLTASNNTAVGFQAAVTNTTGAQLVAIGHSALVSHTTGVNCVAVGYQALQFNTTADNNTAIGYRSLQANTATQNTAIGAEALLANTAVNNVAVGYQAGSSNTTGAGNIFIGQGAGTTRATTGSFNILIGATAQNSATGGASEIVIGTNNPTGKGGSTGFINAGGGGVFQGNNSADWSVASDQRLKKNIVDNTEGLNIISQIRVRNFEYRTAEEVTDLPQSQAIEKQGVQLGVIAQELQEVCSDCVKEESTGVLSVDASNLTWHMINAIKDLKAELDTVKAELAALRG